MDPVNHEASLVGILAKEPGAMEEVLATGLAVSDFADPDLGDLFDKMLALDGRNASWDVFTLAALVDTRLAIRLHEIADSAPLTQNASFFASCVRGSSRRRRAVAQLSALTRSFSQHPPDMPDDELWAGAEARMLELLTDEKGGGYATPTAAEMAIRIADEYERMLELRETGRKPGWGTGFPALDDLAGGFRPKGFYIVGARPGMGKTALTGHFALTAADDGAHVTVFTLEMGDTQIGQRLLANLAMVPTKRIMDADLSQEERDRFYHQLAEFGHGRVTINDRAGETIDTFEAECRRLRRIKRLDVAIVDYVQLMHGDPRVRYPHRTAEIGEISRRLKKLAKALDIVVIAAAQVNRESTKIQGQRPTMAHIKDSGALEQDADGILFIHRPSYFDVNATDPDEVILEKNRHGSPGVITIAAEMRCNKFKELQ